MTTREHDEKAVGAPRKRPAIRVGERLAGRYRIVETLAPDPLSERFRAEDEASARPVLIRVPLAELCPDEATRRRVGARLEGFVGHGGRFLPGLLDAGLDEHRVYVVEPLPEGVRLLDVIQARAANRRRFRAEEVLPVAARLAAALDALPSSACHGEVLAEHVYVNPDGLSLVEGMLGSVLPEAGLKSRLRKETLPASWAPEWCSGALAPSTDIYGLGLLVLSMLTGEVGHQAPRTIPASLGAVGDALVPMIDPEPRRRPRSTRPLLEALAQHAGLPFPELDAGRFSPSAHASAEEEAHGFDQERTVMMTMPELEEHAARSSRQSEAADPNDNDDDDSDNDSDDDEALPDLPEEEKTRQVSIASLGPRIDDLDDVGDEDDTPPDGLPLGALAAGDPDAPIPPLPPPDVAEALAPPRLAAAPRAATPPKAPPPVSASAPVRRAEAAVAAPSGPVLAPPVIARPPAPDKPATPKPASLPPPPPPSPKAAAPKGPAKPLPPPPVPRTADPPPATAPEGPPSQPTISISPLAAIPEAPKRRAPSLDVTSQTRHLPTIRPMRPVGLGARANARVIGMAVAIAVAILGASLGFAAFRKYKDEAEREERLRERFEQIQSGDAP